MTVHWHTDRGSGGFKASYESISVRDADDGTYYVRMGSPVGSTPLAEDFEDVEDAIAEAKEIARDKGFPVDDE